MVLAWWYNAVEPSPPPSFTSAITKVMHCQSIDLLSSDELVTEFATNTWAGNSFYYPIGLSLLAGLPAGQNTAISFIHWSKMAPPPRGRHVKCEISNGERVAVPNFTFLTVKKCKVTAPQTVKIWNFATHKFAPEGQIVCVIYTKLLAFVRDYRKPLCFLFGRFRWTDNEITCIYPQWRHFLTNFP